MTKTEKTTPIIQADMIEAWGYPLDDLSQEIIIRGQELESKGHITSLDQAKCWVRGERPRQMLSGRTTTYPKLDFPD